MFGGEYRHSLDAKNRIFIPAKLREELGETFVVAQDIRTKCIKVYSQDGWASYMAPYKEQPRKLSERVMRLLNSTMEQVSPDSQGRIVLPSKLVSFAGIEKNVVVVGCFDYAEIWAEDAYEQMKSEEDLDELLAEVESINL